MANNIHLNRPNINVSNIALRPQLNLGGLSHISPVTVFRPGQIQFDPNNIHIPPELIRPPPDPTAVINFTVKGTVVQSNGVPLSNALVRVFDADLRDDKLLVQGVTSNLGAYTLTYASSALKNPAQGSADLKIKVYRTPSDVTEIATSPIVWNAEKDAVIDVVVDDSAASQTEFDIVAGQILPILQRKGLAVGQIDIGEKSTDIPFLVGQTGLDRTRIEQFAMAHKSETTVNMGSDLLYGLFRQGITTDTSKLVSLNTSTLENSLRRAIDVGTIKPKTSQEVNDAVAKGSQAAIQLAIQPPGANVKSFAGQLLEKSAVDPTKFLTQFATAKNDTIWRDLTASPDFSGKIPAVQQNFKLAALTFNHMPLIDVLQSKFASGQLKSVAQLADFSTNDWKTMFAQQRVGAPGTTVGVPDEIPGDTPEQKADVFAKTMSTMIEATYPHRFVTSRLSQSGDDTTIPGKVALTKFLQNTPNFDFTTSRLTSNSLQGVDGATEVKKSLKAIQKMYSVAPKWEQAKVLVANNVQSAMQINRMGQSVFVTKYSTQLGGRGEALRIYNRAAQIHSTTIELITRFNDLAGRWKAPMIKTPKISFTESEGGIPDLKTLFGSLDLCACDECRSIDGPAAYLVDILHFAAARELIDPEKSVRDDSDNITQVVHRTKPGTNETMYVKDVLFSRRPDIGEIELNCENTKTPVPYVDLVIEILEDELAPPPPFKSFDIPNVRPEDLDKGIPTPIKPLFSPPLSDSASISPIRRGQTWIIDETSFSYSLRWESGKLTAERRGRLTRGTAAERAATPQYLNFEAYSKLRDQVYPWKMPFNLWGEIVDTYLGHVGIHRSEFMETFNEKSRLEILNNKNIAFALLNLGSTEVGVLTGKTSGQTPWKLWGFDADHITPNRPLPDPSSRSTLITQGVWSEVVCSRLDILLKLSGLRYNELLNILQFYDVLGSPVPLTIESTDPNDIYTCDVTKLKLQNGTPAVLHQLCKFVRLQQTLSSWSVFDVAQAYLTFSIPNDQASVESFLVNLANVERLRILLGLQVEQLLGFWAPIGTKLYQDFNSDEESAIPSSPFTRTFGRSILGGRPDNVLVRGPSALTGKLSNILPDLAAGLRTSVADLTILMTHLNLSDAQLDMANLSILYRHCMLVTSLGLLMRQYIIVLKMSGSAPFSSPSATVDFVEQVGVLLSSPFSIDELNYLLRHDMGDAKEIGSSEEETAKTLTEIRTEIKKIAVANPVGFEAQAKELLTQKFSPALGIDQQGTDLLLHTWLRSQGVALGSLFYDAPFIDTATVIRTNLPSYSRQVQALETLRKVTLCVGKWKLTTKQLHWLFELRTSNGGRWLDFDKLPVLGGIAADAVQYVAWQNTNLLFNIRDNLPQGEATLDEVFKNSKNPEGSAAPLLADLCSRTKWPQADVRYLMKTLGFQSLVAFQSERTLMTLMKCASLQAKLGCSAAEALSYTDLDQTESHARSIMQTVKALHDPTLWLTIAKPLRDTLREKQRLALVKYLIANPKSTNGVIWRDSNDLYGHFLIDVEMGPAQMTSRIKQAISSTQLFFQRCLMNLEPLVTADAEYDRRWLEWKTLKSFAITSAARRLYTRPENYLDSSLRDDKTPFFKELETELQQNEVTKEVAEDALANYLEKLDLISHLRVISFYHQVGNLPDGPKGRDILHVFAKSSTHPPTHYYRQRLDSVEWTAWQKIDADITGEHLVPVVWHNRVILMWAIFSEKQAAATVQMPGTNQTLPPGHTFWEMTIAWTEFKQGKWTAKKVFDASLYCPKSMRNAVLDVKSTATEEQDGYSLISLRTGGGGHLDYFNIQVQCNLVEPGSLGTFWFYDLKSKPSVVEDWRDLPKEIIPNFWFSLPFEYPSYKLIPPGTKLKNLTFTDNGQSIKRQLALNTAEIVLDAFDTETPSVLDKKSKVVTLLEAAPTGYSIVFAHQDGQFGSQRPFFFQHGAKSFFVEPRKEFLRLHPTTILDKATISQINGDVFKHFSERPMTAIPKPSVAVAQKSAFLPVFEVNVSSKVASQSQRPGIPAEVATFQTSQLNNFQANLGLKFLGSAIRIDLSDKLKVINKAVAIDNARLRLPISAGIEGKKFKFSTFYHPYVNDFVRELNQNGIEGLLQRSNQLRSASVFNEYSPSKLTTVQAEHPVEDVDMDHGGAMTQYNMELFYHIPVLIAEKLSQNQRFAEAQRFYHFVFDPTDTSSIPSPQRYWKTKKFFETDRAEYSDQAIQNILKFMAKRGDPAELAKLSPTELKYLDALEVGVQRWRLDPFNPYLIARARSTVFQKSIVMKYLDNLIAWGDHLFRMDTMESINEATQLFILASEILGERPMEIPQRAEPKTYTYNTLEDKLDEFSNILADAEETVPPPSTPDEEMVISPKHELEATSSAILFFCVPRNDKLLGYWDTVSDRLFKIRNSMNLQGTTRQLALFEPPIDPSLLMKASAAGIDLGSVLSDINGPLPHYRYSVIAAKAKELCNELQSLANAFLTALEKRDAETLSLLRSAQAMRTLDATRALKVDNVAEADSTIASLNHSKENAAIRAKYYSTRGWMNQWESTAMRLEGIALVLELVDIAMQPLAAGLALVPNIKIGAPTTMGGEWGGANLASSAGYFSAMLGKGAGALSKGAQMASTLSSYWRRKEEWDHQAALARNDLKQFDAQIIGAQIRKNISVKDLQNHDLEIRHAQEIDEYTRSKFTNKDLYDWTVAQLSTIYFQSYQMAYDVAKRAEKAYCRELGLQSASFVQFGYWDSLKKGLLSSERLAYDLKRMEVSYMELNRREYEITRTVSLAQLDPVALIQLKETGSCFFTIPEAIFDLDFPGHYFRRLKTVSLTIPAVVGPYTSVSSTLTLLSSVIRSSSTLSNGKYSRQGDNDPRFTTSNIEAQSIVTSTGQNDSGLFESNLSDPRFLPFEHSGAISSWRLKLPPIENSPFDVQSLCDVLIHLKYTAREAGDPLSTAASTELRDSTLAAIARAEQGTGLARMFSIRHEFPDVWYRMFMPSGTAPQDLRLPLSMDRLPYIVRGARGLKFTRVELFVRVHPDYINTTHSAEKFVVGFAVGGAPTEQLSFVAITLAKWNNVLRGATNIQMPPGPCTLRLGLTNGRILKEAVLDVMAVFSYDAKWT